MCLTDRSQTPGEALPSSTEWENPGAWLISPGVYRIPLPLPGDALRAVNVYAIVAPGSVALVDGGWALDESAAALELALRSIDSSIDHVNTIIVTHLHRDHYTQAIALRERTGARVLAGRGETESLAIVKEHQHDLVPRQLVAILRRHGADDLAATIEAKTDIIEPIDPRHWQDPDAWLDDGDLVELPGRTLQVIATPGHTQGHIVLWDDSANVLFSGDHVLPHITPSIGFEPAPALSPLTDFLMSLDKVLALPDSRLLPAHGPVVESSHARVREQIAHHESRLAACRRAVTGDPVTARDVAEQLRWTRREKQLATLGTFDQLLAVVETVAHLEALTLVGAISREDNGSKVTFL